MNTNPVKTNTGNQQELGSNISSLTRERVTESNAIQIPQISLPKGGGALKSIDEKFEVNAANGTVRFFIPLSITPDRNGYSASLSLSYNSGGGNSPYGLGWSVGYPMIQRKMDKRLPRYQDGLEEDTFMFFVAEDLVPSLVKYEASSINQSNQSEVIYLKFVDQSGYIRNNNLGFNHTTAKSKRCLILILILGMVYRLTSNSKLISYNPIT